MLKSDKNEAIVVSALDVRANFGRLLRRVEEERRSLVMKNAAVPKRCCLASAITCGLPPRNLRYSAFLARNRGAKGRTR